MVLVPNDPGASIEIEGLRVVVILNSTDLAAVSFLALYVVIVMTLYTM